MSEPHYDVVCILLETPFSKWEEDDKQWTIKNGRPTPLFGRTLVSTKSTVNGPNSQQSWYKLFPWLCGSTYLKKLYCWPCLIFGIESCVDLNSVNEKLLNKHEATLWHLKNALRLVDMSKVLKGPDLYKNCSSFNIVEQNKNVLLNRRLMQLLIKAILFFTKQQLPINGCGQNRISSINDKLKELFNLFICESPLELQQQYSKVEDYFKSELLQNDLICCLSNYINDFVKKDVTESLFYSIQLDRVSKSLCLITVRYITVNGLAVERPLGFMYVNKSSSTNEFFDHLARILYPLNYRTKLVAQCYDGASIMKENLNQLQNKVKSQVHQALFIHSCNHKFDEIIVQSLNDVPECQAFFTNLYSIPNFFNSSTKRLKTLNSARVKRGSKIVIKKDQLSIGYKIVSTVCKEFLAFKDTFKNILSDPTFDDASIRQANTYLKCFKDMEYIFLLSVFNVIFEVIEDLLGVLQSQLLDINVTLSSIKKIQVTLTTHHTSAWFDSLYKYSKDREEAVLIGQEEYYNREDVREKFKQLYFTILDSIALELVIRFKDLKNLQFLQLAQFSNFERVSKKLPKSYIQPLIDIYPNVITDFDRLKNELNNFHSIIPYHQQCNILEIVRKMKEDGSCKIFKEVYKLLSLMVTLPYFRLSTDSHIFSPRRIQNYLRNYNLNEKSQKDFQTSLAMLSAGQEVIDHLMSTSMFYDDIIDQFVILKGQTIPLTLLR